MPEPIKNYQDLEVWRVGMDLCVTAYEHVKSLPSAERFELSSQIRRAAVSVPSNVAEGHTRRQPKPFLNHVHIALGSLAELETCLIVSSHLGYLSPQSIEMTLSEAARVGQMLNGLARSIDRRLGVQRLTVGFGLLVGTLTGLLGVLL
jgi:four helix bundle protein